MKQDFKQLFEVTLHSDSVYKLLVFNNTLYSSSRDGSVVVFIRQIVISSLALAFAKELLPTGESAE